MKIVIKMKLDEVAKLKEQGFNVKYVNLRTAYELYGEKVYEDCGSHMYVSVDADKMSDLVNSTLAHL